VLGRRTTIGFSFRILPSRGHVPSPLSALDLRYPSNFGVTISGLGFETCPPPTLEASGLAGCPADSWMGRGHATMEIPIGPTVVGETARVTIVRAPARGGHFALLLYADGTKPVQAQLSLPALLLPASGPFGGRVNVALPLVPSLPEAPNVALVSLSSTLGPAHLTYYEHTGRRTIAYTPRGILLPKKCPPHGFPFFASFGFLDGSTTTARTTVPCPRPAQQGR
jgi:hypothetical protein